MKGHVHRHHGDDPVPAPIVSQMLHQKSNRVGLHPRPVWNAVKAHREGRRVAIHHQETGGGILPGQARQGQAAEFPGPQYKVTGHEGQSWRGNTPTTVGNQNFCWSMMLPMDFSQGGGSKKLEILCFDSKLRFRAPIQV